MLKKKLLTLFLLFYCIIETSRMIRVDIRNYIVQVRVAVSQEHVLVCITRQVARRENDMVLVLASILNFLRGWSE